MVMSVGSAFRGRGGRRGFARGGRSRMKRFYEWEGAAFSGTAASGSSAAFVIVPVAFVQEMQSPTIRRIRGNLMLILEDLTDGDEAVLALGIEVLPTNVSSQYELPHMDANSNRWLWHQYVPLAARPSSTFGPYEDSKIVRVTIDTKAMRKVSDNDDVLLVAQHVANVGVTNVRIIGGVRTLFQAA